MGGGGEIPDGTPKEEPMNEPVAVEADMPVNEPDTSSSDNGMSRD